jgi:predicted transcriptional regulator
MPDTTAASELASRREAQSRVQDALLTAVRERGPQSDTSELLREVARTANVDVVMVQRALWKLVHDGAIDLTDTLGVQEG